MGFKSNLKRRLIRGWFPKEPLLSGRINEASENKGKNQTPVFQSKKFRYRLLLALVLVFFGVLNLFTRQQTLGILLLFFAVGFLVVAYVIEKRHIRPRIGVAVLLVGLGFVALLWSDFAVGFYSNLAVFAGLLSGALSVLDWYFAASIAAVVAAIAVVGALVTWVRNKHPYSHRTYLLPYGAVAGCIFLTYIAILSGVQFEYAIPLSFMASGFLVLAGLRRFTVTVSTLVVLVCSILILGSAIAGVYTTSYIPENRSLPIADAPDADAINLQVRSVFGPVRVYFSADTSEICHVGFLKVYGPVVSSTGSQWISKDRYNTEPASSFNQTVNENTVNISTWSYTTLVNITLNQNYKTNLTISSYYGDIIVFSPAGENPIQSTNITSQYGSVKIIH